MSKKQRFRQYSFWISLASAIVLLLQTVLKPMGIDFSGDVFMSIVNALLGVLVVLGIVFRPTLNEEDDDKQTNKDTTND